MRSPLALSHTQPIVTRAPLATVKRPACLVPACRVNRIRATEAARRAPRALTTVSRVRAPLVVGFDLDMTLFDTRPGIKAAFEQLAVETGIGSTPTSS